MTRRNHPERLGSDRTAASISTATLADSIPDANLAVVLSCLGIKVRWLIFGLGLPISFMIVDSDTISYSQAFFSDCRVILLSGGTHPAGNRCLIPTRP